MAIVGNFLETQAGFVGRPPVPPVMVDKIKALRAVGLSFPAISRKTGISVGKCHAVA